MNEWNYRVHLYSSLKWTYCTAPDNRLVCCITGMITTVLTTKPVWAPLQIPHGLKPSLCCAKPMIKCLNSGMAKMLHLTLVTVHTEWKKILCLNTRFSSLFYTHTHTRTCLDSNNSTEYATNFLHLPCTYADIRAVKPGIWMLLPWRCHSPPNSATNWWNSVAPAHISLQSNQQQKREVITQPIRNGIAF